MQNHSNTGLYFRDCNDSQKPPAINLVGKSTKTKE